MTAAEHLSSYGVSMDVARHFIITNLEDLGTVYDTCRTFGVNNDMIAEILGSDFPGLTGGIVSDFFNANGFDGSALGFGTSTIDIVKDGQYDGSYGGDESGELSIIINDTSASGHWYSFSWHEVGEVYSSVDNRTGDLYLTSSDEDGVPITFTGVVSGDDISGTWSMPVYGDGTFSATYFAY